MVNVNIIPAVTKVIEPEKVAIEVTRDQAEALFALLGFNSNGSGSEVDTSPMYYALRDALGYPSAGRSKYEAVVSEYNWSTLVKLRR